MTEAPVLSYPSSTTGSATGASERGVPATADTSWSVRERIAGDIGRFFVRCLEGTNRGSSGRDRLNLPSRVYVVIRDKAGFITRDPVRVFTKFTEVKSLCAESGDFGQSIFCGFPSQREAKIAVEVAGLSWPAGR